MEPANPASAPRPGRIFEDFVAIARFSRRRFFARRVAERKTSGSKWLHGDRSRLIERACWGTENPENLCKCGRDQGEEENAKRKMTLASYMASSETGRM